MGTLPEVTLQQETSDVIAVRRRGALAARLGLWASGIVTGAGIVYSVGLLAVAFANDMRLTRPSEDVQFWVGLTTLGLSQFILAIVVCIHRSVPEGDRVLSQLAVGFTTLFTGVVSINRFVQLTVVRQATLSGRTEGLARFLPYSSTSVMFALEILGWGVFLSLATLVLTPVFKGGKLESDIRSAAAAYAILSLTGAVGYAVGSKVFLAGFLAWGFVFYIWTGMLVVWFSRILRDSIR